MKKQTSERRRHPSPSAASLRELPEIKFSRYRVTRNRFAARVQRGGIELVHEGPSARSLREIPEADLKRARIRQNPYAARLQAEGITIQVGRGRPRKGEEVGPTPARSIRFPELVWNALEAEARRGGVTVHSVLRYAVSTYLAALPRSRAAETTGRKRRRSSRQRRPA